MIDQRTVEQTFNDAKDAPTSFEDETWLEGFEDGRQIIAHRLALALPEADRAAFLAGATAGRDGRAAPMTDWHNKEEPDAIKATPAGSRVAVWVSGDNEVKVEGISDPGNGGRHFLAVRMTINAARALRDALNEGLGE